MSTVNKEDYKTNNSSVNIYIDNIVSFRDFLNETNELDIWEYQTATFKTKASQHPNKKGYELISKELYNYIKTNKVL